MDSIAITCKWLPGNAKALADVPIQSSIRKRRFMSIDKVRSVLEENEGSLTYLGNDWYEVCWKGELKVIRNQRHVKQWAEANLPGPSRCVTFHKIYSGYYAIHCDQETVGYIDSCRGEGAVGQGARYYLYTKDREITSGTIQHCKKTAQEVWG